MSYLRREVSGDATATATWTSAHFVERDERADVGSQPRLHLVATTVAPGIEGDLIWTSSVGYDDAMEETVTGGIRTGAVSSPCNRILRAGYFGHSPSHIQMRP